MENELNCQELVELVTDYLEDALPPVEQARFEAHLTECDGCTRYLEQMRFTITAAGRLTEESIEPAARADLLQLFIQYTCFPCNTSLRSTTNSSARSGSPFTFVSSSISTATIFAWSAPQVPANTWR
jgi:anti-sigma factor RsiW